MFHLIKHYSRFIKIFLQVVVTLGTVYYIVNKLLQTQSEIRFSDLAINSQQNILWLGLLLVLMIGNWSVEAMKWRLLLGSINNFSFSQALQSVLAGLPTGIFSPNRAGEFVGRLLTIDSEKRVHAFGMLIYGNIPQLLMTFIFGTIGLIYLIDVRDLATVYYKNLLLTVGFISVLLFLLMFNRSIVIKLSNYISTKLKLNYSLQVIPGGLMFKLFLFSFIRYVIFTIQYYITLKCFNINIDATIAFSCITVIFLVITIMPTFAFTEIGVRGSVAIYFLSIFSANHYGILASSFLLWIINIAIPSIVGLFYLNKWKLGSKNN